jgi:hypothetical protein
VEITVTVMISSHPEFDLFADARVAGRQVAAHGDRPRINEWISRLRRAAESHGHTVKIDDQSVIAPMPKIDMPVKIAPRRTMIDTL